MVQLVCVIMIDNDPVLTKIFFTLFGCVLTASIILGNVKREIFPIVTITDGKICVKAKNMNAEFDANQVAEVYCDTVISLSSVSLMYRKGITFIDKTYETKISLNRLSINKIITIQSIVEYYQSLSKYRPDIISNPVILKNNFLRAIVTICIGIIIAFWTFIGFLIIGEEGHEEKTLLCAGLCLFMIALVLLAHSNSLVKIESHEKLCLTTFFGKRIVLSPEDILKADTHKASKAGEERVHYLNIQLKNGKHKKFKISLSTNEDKHKFHKLSEYLIRKNIKGMSKALIFLTDGFEEIEALATIDILRRGEVELQTVSITGKKEVIGGHQIPVIADILFEEADFNVDILIIPGGTIAFNDHAPLKQQIKAFADSGKRIAAICAAPMVLGGLGLLKGKRATCYPGFEQYLDGADFAPEKVITDGNITTGRGPGLALDFALEVLRLLNGKEAADKVSGQLLL